MVKKKTCVFISGQGTNLKNLIFYSRNNNFPIKISLVICNNKKAYGINYAKKYRIPYIFINTKFQNYENKILLNLKKYKISFICLAGFMKIISNKLIKNYQKKIINIHPSLLPKFKGLNTFSRILKNKEIKTGATDPKEAEENTLRKLYGISIDKNSVHGSDSEENAKKEIEFFFKN